MSIQEIYEHLAPLGESSKRIIALAIEGSPETLKKREITKENLATTLCALLALIVEGRTPEPAKTNEDNEGQNLPTASQSSPQALGGSDSERNPRSPGGGGDNRGNGGPQDALPHKSGQLCKSYRRGQCQYGFKGLRCPDEHPPYCTKFTNHGRMKGGCVDENCTQFHFRICPKNFKKQRCEDDSCNRRHLRGLQGKRRVQAEQPAPKVSLQHYRQQHSPRPHPRGKGWQQQHHQNVHAAPRTYAEAAVHSVPTRVSATPSPTARIPFLGAQGGVLLKQVLEALLQHL